MHNQADTSFVMRPALPGDNLNRNRPADAKLLIIHADDLALAHAQNMASFEALNRGSVSSASIMVPCPWLTEVVAYAKTYPEADLGLHLTLTSEWKNYRWGPVAPRHQVKSLLDPHGYFFSDAKEAVRHINPIEAEREIRAQIETALRMGIRPTHLDSHMGVLNYWATPALMAMFVNVAQEYNLPFLMAKRPSWQPEVDAAVERANVVLNQVFMAAPPLEPENWLSFYIDLLKKVRPGVSELLVHLAYDDAEMKAVTGDQPDYGGAWRQRDFDVITGPEFRKALKENDISVVSWRDLQRTVRRK